MAVPTRRSERLPPADAESEAALLGSILIDANAITKVAGTLTPADFWMERHRLTYQTMLNLYEQGEPVDYLTVMNALGERLEEAGGVPYLTDLISTVPTSLHVERYAEITMRYATQRRLISAGSRIIQMGYDLDMPPDEAVERAEAMLAGIGGSGSPDTVTTLADSLAGYVGELAAIRDGTATAFRVPTGFKDLDTILQGGFGNSDLIILGGRPAMGKTALALQLAATAGYTYGKTVLFFSLEMSTGQLVGRLLASTSGVELSRLRDPQVELVNQEMQRLGNAFGQLAETTLLIDDSPEITVSSLRSRVRRIQMGRPIDMIVVDHLQMLVPGGGSRNRNQEVEEAARQLKALAREMNIPVIVLSQLSRATEAGSDKRPSLSNLRDSGGIEQYADVVILLYREEYYQPDTARQGAADLIIAKHRNGASGQVTLLFTQRTTNFTDLEAVYAVGEG